jgi:hypothetical protein
LPFKCNLQRYTEVSIDHYQLFKSILSQVPIPMAPLESLASSAVRTVGAAQVEYSSDP